VPREFIKLRSHLEKERRDHNGGETGIRTLGTLTRTMVFAPAVLLISYCFYSVFLDSK